MTRLTVTVTDEQDEYLASKVEVDDDLDSKSAAIRECIRSDERVNDLERENQRLRQQLAATNQRIDDVTELVEYVEEERQMQRQQRRKENAPVWTRAKYWVFGVPSSDDGS